MIPLKIQVLEILDIRKAVRYMRVLYLSFRCDYWFRRKLHICCFQYGVLLQDVLLGLVVAEGLMSKEREEKSVMVTKNMLGKTTK